MAEEDGMSLGAVLLLAAGLAAAFWVYRVKRQPPPAPPVETQAQVPAPLSSPAQTIVNMGSSIQKAQTAAQLQTQSQAQTGAAVSEAAESR